MANEKTKLTAVARAKAGKGAARATRRTGQIPAVIYGDKKEPILISLPKKEFSIESSKGTFFTHLCDLDVDGKKVLVLPRDVQLHPVTDVPLHVDFLRVTDKTIIRVQVPLHTINEKNCPGLVKGGVLNLVRHEVEVFCSATNIPEEFVVDMTGFEVGHSVRASDLNLPKGVEPVNKTDYTVITIVAPSAMKSEADAAVNAEGATAEAAPAEAAPAAAKK